ncbi:S-adenosyl-L-methionine-dependent methyltransferase [Leucogyrophana mollusca]|uniref:S-adenosyl-L-methionine-dependent methyltransferase n=1 Tax=Leucogyrophana mollusca TaxID=85980 RepID=A0ACB8BNW5_9AGAM|nr:S-adenosyl-L-methionine-dependent methyltransferase [Leucogyrophana mollusca]
MAIEFSNRRNAPPDREQRSDALNGVPVHPLEFDHDGSDDGDGSSDTSSILTELGPDDYPTYFRESEGRLFHSHGDLPYPLPVDAAEQQRLNDQHKILRDLIRSHYVGPVPEVLAPAPGPAKRVLDLCTGTGRWPMDMASSFPHVKFYGVDIVPIATRIPRPNVHFEMADVMQPLRYRDNTIDFVHARSVSLAITNYPDMLEEVARVLKPGGLFFSGEVARQPMFDSSFPLDPAVDAPGAQRFFEVINNMLARRGLEQISTRIPRWLQDSGQFTAPIIREYTIPIGDWESAPHSKRVGVEYRQVMERFADSLRPMLRSDDAIDEREFDEVVRDYVHDLYNVPGMIGLYRTVWARKI